MKRESRRRVWCIPLDVEQGWLSAPVQKAVRRWRPVVGEQVCREFFRQAIDLEHAALDAEGLYRTRTFELRIHADPTATRCFRDIWSAVAELCARKDKPDYWLCVRGLGWGIGEEYDAHGPLLPKWDEIRAQIKAESGPSFTSDAIIKAAQRLGLARY